MTILNHNHFGANGEFSGIDPKTAERLTDFVNSEASKQAEQIHKQNSAAFDTLMESQERKNAINEAFIGFFADFVADGLGHIPPDYKRVLQDVLPGYQKKALDSVVLSKGDNGELLVREKKGDSSAPIYNKDLSHKTLQQHFSDVVGVELLDFFGRVSGGNVQSKSYTSGQPLPNLQGIETRVEADEIIRKFLETEMGLTPSKTPAKYGEEFTRIRKETGADNLPITGKQGFY